MQQKDTLLQSTQDMQTFTPTLMLFGLSTFHKTHFLNHHPLKQNTEPKISFTFQTKNKQANNQPSPESEEVHSITECPKLDGPVRTPESNSKFSSWSLQETDHCSHWYWNNRTKLKNKQQQGRTSDQRLKHSVPGDGGMSHPQQQMLWAPRFASWFPKLPLTAHKSSNKKIHVTHTDMWENNHQPTANSFNRCSKRW